MNHETAWFKESPPFRTGRKSIVRVTDVLSVGLKACAFGRSFLEGERFDMFVVMLGGNGVLLILRLGFRRIGCGCASLIF